MPSFIGPELQWLPSLLLIPFRVLGPTLLSPGDFGHYSLKSADHRALTTLCRRFFRSLRNARLTAIKLAFGLDIISVYTPSQNNFGPRKSNLHPLIFFKKPLIENIFWIVSTIFFVLQKHRLAIYMNKYSNDTYLS